MAGKPTPSGSGPDDYCSTPSSTRTPGWMRTDDEIGQTVVLVLRCKVDDDHMEPNGSYREPRLPEPFIIGKTVELAIGVKQARNVKASREGRGSRYLLRSNSRKVIDKLITLTELTDGTPIEIFQHPTLNTVQGIVYEPDSICTNENIIAENLADQDVHAVRRIKKRTNGKLQNTPLLVLSFHGTVLPDYVYFGLSRIKVRPYYPSPMMCFNCGMYGHLRKSCQQSGICMRCSQPSHLVDGEQCENTPYCFHCKSEHSVTSRDCAKFKEEDKIVHMKVNQCISFAEARRRYLEENRRENIARVVQEQLKQEIVTKDHLIASLQNKIAILAKELDSFKSGYKTTLLTQPLTPIDAQPFSDQRYLSSTQPDLPATPQTTDQRHSRKDNSFVSPPAKKRDNRDIGSINNIRTRSRSNKRIFEISPTDAAKNRGKRNLQQSGTKSNTGISDN
ncbi:uncharacterized protein LOC134223083 [Armigeres subalbatus]|uniref:uncharacterized protein LOC134223083 n=1 Tax=Armigeres subalbatus TaxID=124917 RepID=UPI002ED4EF35